MGMLAAGAKRVLLATRREIDMAKKRLARLTIALVATAACLAGLPGAHAQDSDDVTVDVGNCRELKSPEERRACYGARVDAAVQEREQSAATSAPESRASSRDDERARPPRARRDG